MILNFKKYTDKKLLLILIVFYTIYNIIFIGKIFYFKEILGLQPYSPWDDLMLFYIVPDWISVILFISFIAYTTKVWIEQNKKWSKILLFHLIFSILFGIIINIFGDIVSLLFGELTLSTLSFSDYVSATIRVVDLNFLTYFSMVSIIYIYNYLKRIEITRNQKNKLENQLLSAQINALNNQLQPHFLFNTLNTITTLIDTDQTSAKSTVNDLGQLLRTLLRRKTPFITIEEELDFTSKYISIIKTRFEDEVEFNMEIDRELHKLKIPAMILQPIIENSLQYGFSRHHLKISIDVRIWTDDNDIHFLVSNNGRRLINPPNLSTEDNHGLSNIYKRIKQIYGENAKMCVSNKSNLGGVYTSIQFPKDFSS